ncbi:MULTISPECIES: ATP-binding protein [unclassified Leifsonia]|uniref:AAA family ATPase n=1 Tax=unclassified Leifsonia TaxID=2663824 RepID=UPI0008A7FF7B|nr:MULTISPECIES: ATP-binding protein [unclassified Leifsonia]SEI16600.1 Predicted kinase [Leifsonia sp. CL154]SFM07548.1 Predicted kinase [Leifsonia sp. CL147]
MCGPAGAGKSTVARQLEADGTTRLSFDQEAWNRGLRVMPLSPELREEIERELRARLVQLVADGVDVVRDFSFWSRRALIEYRELLRPLGIEPVTVYLDTPRQVASERMRARRLAHEDDYPLDEALIAAYFDHFEPPTEAEGPLTVIHIISYSLSR